MGQNAATRFMHSRAGAIMMAGLAVMGARFAAAHGHTGIIHPCGGHVLFPVEGWLASHGADGWANIMLNLLIAFMMIYLNKIYNMLRGITMLHAGIFMIMQMAIPPLLGDMYQGTFLCLTLLACVFLMYPAFSDPAATRNVFLTFCLLSAGVMLQYAFIVYIPVFIIGCAQMRIMSFRTIIAAILGLVTPWWITIGAGMVSTGDIRIPAPCDIFGDMDASMMLAIVTTVAVSGFVAVTAWVLNFMKMMSYNAPTRAYNGLITIMMFVTIPAMVLDHGNILTYAPVLNCCASFHIGHFFATHKQDQSYIAIFSTIIIYLSLYVWMSVI